MNIALLLEMVGETFPDRTAFVGDSELSFGELLARSRRGAAWMSIQPGTVTGFLGLNSTSLPLALFSSAQSNRAFAPLNYRLPDEDLRKLAKRIAPGVIIADDDMSGRVADIEGLTVIKRTDFERLCDMTHEAEISPGEDDAIAVILFTSGTTGEAKAAILRHEKLFSYVIGSVEMGSAEEEEAALVGVPPYHIAGISAILTGVYSARRSVYLKAFSPHAWIDCVAEQHVTQAMVVPTMLDLVLNELETRDEKLPHLRALSYGGGRMPVNVIERALNWLPHVGFVNAYGLTETSSTIALLTPEDHRLALQTTDPAVRNRLSSVGKPLPTIELEIRNPDGSRQSPGEVGEIYVRGPQVAGEYLHKNALNSDGWFGTNDAGWIDEGGYLFIDGRLDDIIVRGGENISPGEVEDVLRANPIVSDVAVFGVPDERWGESIVAAITPSHASAQKDELSEWVRSRLKSTKTPQMWIFKDELPYNETGKLLRRELKAELG